jgi:hypothetical protein
MMRKKSVCGGPQLEHITHITDVGDKNTDCSTGTFLGGGGGDSFFSCLSLCERVSEWCHSAGTCNIIVFIMLTGRAVKVQKASVMLKHTLGFSGGGAPPLSLSVGPYHHAATPTKRKKEERGAGAQPTQPKAGMLE